ncbi:MAG: hypothetical protein A3D52_01150 [Candidatus Taylorbacteria bacterium RIFCSPHIGHO2_02_FULL_44_36]|uniref:Response regulatory domain-containing protein n=1 Tax=Candidatus Taylorbacteria bacterium RIFCSPLOWO2_12_FULL_44_15c TaxID=1802333 RepID=A0A1G2P4P1_9BACT|nr:MAG: hypothetical protein A3D52_01150 [Candidatus Taylorbacteria bacterium RIFCSPHIGHO2_02_FULL_44_36]OHA38172.1 MAG: hypothetical protein A3I97_02060 [Candidatus Taylorbacteria bacterium RIFCSPLOWO2_02_FULL_44_35]OHA43310.1 MAG: hypothetical protein A3G03_01400 [Candidatus Taylorbacteria bacterium RIFCSPLOWO2_12_FULL_44_15c]
MKVLLVEDNKFARDTVAEALQSLGHNAVVVADKGAACQIIQERLETIEMILTDCDLPAPDEGLEIIDFARKTVGFRGPIILMSGRYRAIEAGKVGAEFLPKPFGLENLEFAIQRAEIKGALPAFEW